MPLYQNAAAGRTAVSMGWLLKFAERVPAGYTTSDIVTHIVVPETRSELCRYVDTLPPECCNRPRYFISHRWAASFHHLVNAIRRHLGDKDGNNVQLNVFVWLDIFAVNQHPGKAQDDDLSRLQDVIQYSDKTLLVMDGHGQVLRRVWCLFEIFKTVSRKGVANLLVLAHEVNLMGLKDIFIKLNVAEAQATNEADRQQILDDIRKTIGLEQMNNLIRTALVDSTKMEVNQLKVAPQRDLHLYFSALNKAAQMLTLAGSYGEAEPLMREALHLACEVVGERSTAVASCINNLSEVLRYQGKFGEAEPLQRQAVELSEEIMGKEHPITATYLGNLAQLEMALGRPLAAEPLLRSALDISTKANGLDSIETAVLLNSLASLLLDLAKFDDAEKYYRLALAAIQKQLGANDPEQVAYIANLAGVLQEREQNEEAQQLLEQALALCHRTLGEQHPMTATVLNNLGEALARQGRIDKAEPIMRKALEVREQLLGWENPATASSLNNLGGLLMNQGKVEEAAAAFRKSLQITRTLLGPDHPIVANRLNNLASVLAEQGNLDEAEFLMREALEARIKSLGEDHIDTAASMSNLASLLFQQGKSLEEAWTLYKKIVAVARHTPGFSQNTFLTSLTSLAMLQHQLGINPQDTMDLLKEAIQIATALHGSDSIEVEQFTQFMSVVQECLEDGPSTNQMLVSGQTVAISGRRSVEVPASTSKPAPTPSAGPTTTAAVRRASHVGEVKSKPPAAPGKALTKSPSVTSSTSTAARIPSSPSGPLVTSKSGAAPSAAKPPVKKPGIPTSGSGTLSVGKISASAAASSGTKTATAAAKPAGVKTVPSLKK